MIWIVSCDLNGWEGQAARDYDVLATARTYLSDTNKKILGKPLSREKQLLSWMCLEIGNRVK